MNFFSDLLQLIYKLMRVWCKSTARWILPAKFKSVEGEICLITGAGRGLGRLLAMHFALRKAKLILWGRSLEGLEETARMVRELGGSAFVDVCDVSSREQIRNAAVRAREAVGDVTILVNNAGVTFAKELEDLKDSEIEHTFRVNSFAPIWTIREFLPHMKKINHGHIVTIASSTGLIVCHGMPDYCASKSAAVGFHQALYLDLQNREGNNVKSTLVCPYLIKTGMLTGVDIKRSWLVPALEPEACAKAAMHAILTERPFVAIPRMMYLMYTLITWLDMEGQIACYEFLGANKALHSFVPTRDNQLSAVNQKLEEVDSRSSVAA